mmetsp:Transcript_144786/g.361058  ORF Transcript_144786/g.361058 Transcript_144786/m.361058 type:complete len:245 (-) Transcript_144786:1139-1873(-)
MPLELALHIKTPACYKLQVRNRKTPALTTSSSPQCTLSPHEEASLATCTAVTCNLPGKLPAKPQHDMSSNSGPEPLYCVSSGRQLEPHDLPCALALHEEANQQSHDQAKKGTNNPSAVNISNILAQDTCQILRKRHHLPPGLEHVDRCRELIPEWVINLSCPWDTLLQRLYEFDGLSWEWGRPRLSQQELAQKRHFHRRELPLIQQVEQFDECATFSNMVQNWRIHQPTVTLLLDLPRLALDVI